MDYLKKMKKTELIEEIEALQEKVAGLERALAEREPADEALKELLKKIERAKQEWESTADSLPELVCLVDDRGRIIRANRTVETWNLGRVVDVKGREVHELLHPGCTDSSCYLDSFWEGAWEESLRGQPAQCEAYDEFLKRHVLVQVEPWRDWGKGTALGSTVVVVRDITERKRAEEELRRERDLAEALEEAAAAVSSTLDLDEVLDHILEQAERVVAGDAFSIILIEDDVGRVARSRGYELPGEEIQPLRFDIPIAKYSKVMKMARTGKPVIVPDTSVDPDWVPAARDQGWRRSYVGVPIQLGDVTVGFLSVSGTGPGQFGPEDARRMQAFASHAAIAIENARLFEGVQQKSEELALLLDMATTVSSTLELDYILRTLAEKMTTSVGATFCRIALLNEANQTLTIAAVFAAHDLDWDPGLGRQYALADASWHRQVIERGEIMILRQDDPSKAVSETECRIALSEGIQSALLIPLMVGDRTLGVVSLGEMRSWQRIPFTADRARLCQAMANATAVAIEKAQLLDAVTRHRRDLQRLSAQLINAQEAERRRISRELHDEVGQALTMISINLAAIEKELLSELPPMARERLAEAGSLADQTLEQIRELSLDLRPTMLDDLGLISTLRWYMNRYAKRLNIEVKFEAIELGARLPADIETVLYRAAQEALTNVARHAQANRVNVRLERKVSTVVAFIEDNGQGFDVEKLAGRDVSERGVGLLGIRERVASLGGSFSIQSRPGQGTRLTIEIPS